jgi:hypothetical protein
MTAEGSLRSQMRSTVSSPRYSLGSGEKPFEAASDVAAAASATIQILSES